jgi:hypothetical protein
LEKYQRNPLDEDNKMKKVYVDNSNQVTILCPKCGLEQTKNVFKFKDSNKRLKAKCKCGEAFGFTLDFRKNYRKNVQLAGEYLIQGKDEKGEIVIEDISMKGIRFSCLNPNHISKNDIVELKFNLDTPMEMEINPIVVIKWTTDRNIGGLFLGPNSLKQDLGFFLSS